MVSPSVDGPVIEDTRSEGRRRFRRLTDSRVAVIEDILTKVNLLVISCRFQAAQAGAKPREPGSNGLPEEETS